MEMKYLVWRKSTTIIDAPKTKALLWKDRQLRANNMPPLITGVRESVQGIWIVSIFVWFPS